MLPKRKLLPADTRDMTDEGFALWYQDQMGCVHHSNYIRWMEEARVNLMEQMGCGYKAMEASGIMSRFWRCTASTGPWYVLMTM